MTKGDDLDIAAWAARKTNARAAQAKRALDALPDTPRGKAVPFPYAPSAEYKRGTTDRELNRRIASAPVGKAAIAQLNAIQHSVNARAVTKYIDTFGNWDRGEVVNPTVPTDHPIVVVAGGKHYIHDGHNRTTAAKLLGETEVEARVVDLDASESKG